MVARERFELSATGIRHEECSVLVVRIGSSGPNSAIDLQSDRQLVSLFLHVDFVLEGQSCVVEDTVVELRWQVSNALRKLI